MRRSASYLDKAAHAIAIDEGQHSDDKKIAEINQKNVKKGLTKGAVWVYNT